MSRLSRLLVTPLLLLALCCAWLSWALDIPNEATAARYGPRAQQIYREWTDVMRTASSAGEAEQLKLVNQFLNRRIQFRDDMEIWGKSDYWATPLEMFSKGAGDCEDYSIAKYLSLRALNIPADKLRLVYVKARIGGAQSNVTQAHMVVAYYPAPGAEPLILDNLLTTILPAPERPDLIPVFSFNASSVWIGNTVRSGAERLTRWQDLLTRARNEGFRY